MSFPIDNQPEEKLQHLAASMDVFEGYAPGQANRIAWVADALAEKFGLARRDRDLLEQAALLHDLGEVQMAREYIGSSRTLTMEERLDLERHPVIGEQEIAKLAMPKGTQLLVRWHHEWWNGNGYPDRLEADQIPLSARILHVADVYCALTANRPWRRAMSDEAARRHLTEWSALEFDPSVVLAFRSVEMLATTAQAVTEPAAVLSTFR